MNFPEARSIAWKVVEELLGITFSAAATGTPSASTVLHGDGVWREANSYATGSSTPTPTAGSGAFTTVSASVNYTNYGNRTMFRCSVSITTNGTAAGYVAVTLPFTAVETTACSGIKVGTDTALSCRVTDATLFIWNYDGTYPGADGVTLSVAGVVRV